MVMNKDKKRLFEVMKYVNSNFKKNILNENNEIPNNTLESFVNSLPNDFYAYVNSNIQKFGGDVELAVEDSLESIMESGDTIVRNETEKNNVLNLISNYKDDFVNLMNEKFENKIMW